MHPWKRSDRRWRLCPACGEVLAVATLTAQRPITLRGVELVFRCHLCGYENLRQDAFALVRPPVAVAEALSL